MVGLPKQLSIDKRTQYYYSHNNWDESVTEFWREALKNGAYNMKKYILILEQYFKNTQFMSKTFLVF